MSLYDDTLGEVVATEIVIYLTEGAKQVRQLPYRAGPGHLKLVKDYVEKMLKLDFIESATTPWA